MMRLLQAVFLGLFIYGMWAGFYGAGLLALSMFAFNAWAERKFAEQDRAYALDQRNAKPAERPTSDALAEHDCECL